MLSVALQLSNLSAIDEADEFFPERRLAFMSWRDDRLAPIGGAGPLIRHFEEGGIWRPPIQLANALNHSRHSNTLKVDADGVVHDMERNADLADFYQLREFPFDHQGLNAVLEPFRN